MTHSPPIRVLIVDDSAFARKVLRELISQASDCEVVGIAHGGVQALEQCVIHQPDVMTLDLMMPELDGLGVLSALAQMPKAPQVVLVSSSTLDSYIAVQALQLGALSLVQKATALATERLYELGDELLRQIRVAAQSRQALRLVAGAALPKSVAGLRTGPRPHERQHGTELIVIGTSTGGPYALTRIFSALPAALPVPVAAVVHIPVGYTASLAERLNRSSALHVVEASEGLEVHAGMAVLARAGIHLKLERVSSCVARCSLSYEPAEHLHRPAVDVLFGSAASAFGSGVLAAVMTGMGEDGLVGAGEIQKLGGRIFTEHAASCAVYGMPRAVFDAGLSQRQLTLEQMADALCSSV